MPPSATGAQQCVQPQSDAAAPPQTRDDTLLPAVRRAIAGDPIAIDALVLQVGPHLLRTVRQVLGSKHPDAEDVAQDALIAVLQALPEFRGESSFLHFAHRVALLTALAARRRQFTRERHTVADEAEDYIDENVRSSPHIDLLAQLRKQVVRSLLVELQPAIAEAIALHFVLGFTVDEIATLSAISANTVWSRLRLGKATIRQKLRRNPRLAELLGGFE